MTNDALHLTREGHAKLATAMMSHLESLPDDPPSESTALFERMKAAARELNTINEFGALHIFVADGNCEDEHVEWCIQQPNITDEEHDFATRMLEQFTEEQRFGVYAFSQCRDLWEER